MRYLEMKFDVHCYFCSIHEMHDVLMKSDDGFVFAMPWWSFVCVQLRFLGKICWIELEMMNVVTVHRTLIFHCFAQKFHVLHGLCYCPIKRANSIISFQQPKHGRFVKWGVYLQVCHSGHVSHWIKSLFFHFYSIFWTPIFEKSLRIQF